MRCDGVFEGGGVKGIGLAGAAAYLLESGYAFENLAGTSAGAIVASLLAAGYGGSDVFHIMQSTDYLALRQEDWLDRLGLVGKALSIALEFGIYSADYFENWLFGLLDGQGIRTFRDLRASQPGGPGYRFMAVASDLTDERLLILPRDLRLFGLNPDDFSVAKAVRMSMSIPVFFEPYRLKGPGGLEHIIVDGGMLSNYPIWLLDDGENAPVRPVFGFKLTDDCQSEPCSRPRRINNIVDYVKSLAATLLDAHDNYHISVSRGDFARSILISSMVEVNGVKRKLKATDFDITPNESEAMYTNGRESARRFLAGWDFEAWKKSYRQQARRDNEIPPKQALTGGEIKPD